jgi:HrpA-like RNA helicase
MNDPLYTFYDTSLLYNTGAKELVAIPVWKGNRILDTAHAESIRKAVGEEVRQLDSGYRIIQYEELDAAGHTVFQRYLIDGQHRREVLRRYFEEHLCEPDFPVLVTVKQVANESEAIAYFNALNHCKPQEWRLDPNLLLNMYVDALVKRWGSDKKHKFLRAGTTRRPYLSVDALRQALRQHIEILKQTEDAVTAFVKAVEAWNEKEVRAAQLRLATIEEKEKEAGTLERCIEVGFMLAFDGKFRWISECIV